MIMINPHYQRLTVTYRKFFEQGGLRGLWLVLMAATALIYWQASYPLYFWIPILIYGCVGVLGVETARFVATDRQQPVYEMTLLTPISAKTILKGYRQAALVRTGRWFGLDYRFLGALIIGLYVILSYKMAGLVEIDIQNRLGQSYYLGETFIHNLTILIFTIWVSFLFGTLAYYLLMIEVGIDLGLRFDNWLISVGVSFITAMLVWGSSLFVIALFAYLVISLVAYINVYIPVVFVIVAFLAYPLYWRSVFSERALGIIRAAEEPRWGNYVDVA